MGKPDTLYAAQLAERIAKDFYGSKLDLSAREIESIDPWSQMPEVACVGVLRDSGVSSREIRLYLTFIAAMDRARDANRLWRDGLTMFQSCPSLFEPAVVSAVPLDTLREVLAHFGVSQRHRPDSEAWRVIAQSLSSNEGTVCRVIEDGLGNADHLLKELRSTSGGRNRFPLLRGPKIGPVWVRIMANPGEAAISGIDSIPVAVDVHVRRVTENLGVTDTDNLDVIEAKPIIHSAWRKAVVAGRINGPSGIAGTCAALDPALWFFGKYGCSYCETQQKQVPISDACKGCRFGR